MYDESFLQRVAVAIKNAKSVNKAFLYFNNTAETSAIKNARFLMSEVRSRKSEEPET
jgi:uncharacterized protein YecE (DUF72 family)